MTKSILEVVVYLNGEKKLMVGNVVGNDMNKREVNKIFKILDRSLKILKRELFK